MQLSAGGVLSGTPTQDGAFDFVIRAADSSGAAATKAFSIQVGLGLSITTPQALPGIPVGTPYNVKLDAINGTPPYTWDVPPPDQLPPGLTLDAAKGILSGTPLSAGQYNFPIRVTDAAKAAYTKIFSLAVGATSAALQVNPIGLVFNAFNGGDSPAPKFLSVTSTTGFPIPFTARVDGCSPGSATPKWLEVRPVKGSTPARLRVAVDSTGLTGRLEACITLTGNRQDTSVRVQLNVNEQGPKLEVQPESLRFSGSPAALAESIQAILIRNAGGGGSRPFRAFAKRASTWLALSPTTGQTAPNAPSLVRVSVIPGTLRRGVYFDTIVVQSLAETLEVPVVLLIGAAGPVIGVSQNGVRFDARSLNGFANQKNVSVLNLGEGTLNWKAEVVSGSWLALQDPAGQTVRGRPARLGLVANPGTLPPGGQYGLVKISDPQAANSPQFVVAVLNLADSAKTAALPDPSPSGLFFVANQSNSQTQTIRLFTSSLTEVAFDASASTEDGGDWLSVDPAQGKTYTSNPAVLTVTVKTLNLPPDVYRGDITVHLGGAVVRTTNVTLIVPKLGASALSSKSETRGLAGCAPKSMVLTHTGLVNSFGAPTGWPTPLVVRVSDDCGDPVTNAQVVATFSNGDPALPLRMSDPQVGLYAGTWSASGASDAVTVTAVANSALLGRAAREIIGTVTAAQAPVLNRDSTYNAWNAERSGPIAPGTWVSIYGSNLAPGPVTPKDFPFPTLVNGTTVLVGGVEAPLFYVSPTQINALIPAELAPAQEYSILVAANGGYTLPETLVTTAVRPGVLAFFPNKPIIAQHADYSLITDASPAKPGENFTMYLLGMGDTDPKVATNAPAPSTPPFALVTTQPEVRINGAAAPVSYAGLTPGTVGLYQINTKVPDDAPDGQLTVTVTQGDATANEVVIPVKR
jgi:uncharacterized protein (TIGR03437 family)